MKLWRGSDGVVVEYNDDDGYVVVVVVVLGVWRRVLLWGDGVLIFWNGKLVVGGWRGWWFCYG